VGTCPWTQRSVSVLEGLLHPICVGGVDTLICGWGTAMLYLTEGSVESKGRFELMYMKG